MNWRWFLVPWASVPAVAFSLPLMVFGYAFRLLRLSHANSERLALIFEVQRMSWQIPLPRGRRWIGFGFGAPFVVLLHPGNIEAFPREAADIEEHELRHVDQWFMWGPLLPLVWFILSVIYGYRRNPLERLDG